jgi:hypothetical protein
MGTAYLKMAVSGKRLSWDWRPRSYGKNDLHAVQVVKDEWAFTESDVHDMVQRVWAEGARALIPRPPIGEIATPRGRR